MKRIMAGTPPEKKRIYRQEAERIRAKALEAVDAEVRVQLLWIATLYDRLANHIADVQQSNPSYSSRPEGPTE
ncbi:MAG TPA: hypothetical protein VHW25_10045 [Steroidobacteraceae bacterium]|jgi:hypothetical protein|nr:hypothetical protein [Steroidobacteraceae bacterium]